MTAALTLPNYRPRNDFLAKLRTIQLGIGGNGAWGISAFDRRAAAAAAVALHVEDSFTAADGTNLNGWTPDVANTPGNTWAAVVNNWSIISNRARGTDYALSVMVIEFGAANGTITMPCARSGNNNGIVARYVDTDNYWYVFTSSGGGGFGIVERTGGTETERASYYDVSNSVVTMTVTLTGNSIAVNWNGNNISYTSSQHASATKHGIRRQDFQDTGVAEWWKMVS